MMKSVEMIDMANKEHGEFMYDLGMACKNEYLNDYDSDIILLLNEAEKRIVAGYTVAFLCRLNEKPIGIMWVDLDNYRKGYIRIGIMPENRNGFNAQYFIDSFVEFCFNTLNLRKLIWLPEKEQRTIEKMVRARGFKKEGFQTAEYTRNGQDVDIVRLALEHKDYKEKPHE